MRRVVLALVFLLLASGVATAGMLGGRGGPPAVMGGICAQATTFLANTSGLDTEHQGAYVALICGLVTDGVISSGASMASTGGTPFCGTKLDTLWIMATANATTANLDLCGHTAYRLVPNGSPNFTPDQGYLGVDASTTVFLNTGFNPATAGGHYTQNSGHLSVWSLTNATASASGGNAIGYTDNSSNSAYLFPRYSSGAALGGVNVVPINGPTTAVGDSLGYYVISRDGASLETLYKNGTSIGTSTAASTPLLSLPAYILGINTNGSATTGSGLRIAMASMGSALSSGDVTALNTRICTYLTTLNGTCGAAVQTISSITPSSCSFTAGTMNGPVCNISVVMSPSGPASTAALTLTGTNSGAFHLVGPGCANISLGTCTIQQSSATGGTTAGTYNDVNVVATQSGISNSPVTQMMQLTGTGGTSPVALLHVSTSNPRYFATPDNLAVYLTGNHTWTSGQSFANPGPFSFTAMIDYMKTLNVNFVRHWDQWFATVDTLNSAGAITTPLPFNRSGTCCANDGGNKFDLSSLNQAYFDKLKGEVEYAASKGMYIMPLLFNLVDYALPGSWNTDYWNGANNTNGTTAVYLTAIEGGDPTLVTLQQAYLRKFLDTLGTETNVLYEVSNELTQGHDADNAIYTWQEGMANLVHSYETSQGYLHHPVGIEYTPSNNAKIATSPADFIIPYDFTVVAGAFSFGKPSVVDSDHYYGLGGGTDWWWKSFTNGNLMISMDDMEFTGLTGNISFAGDARIPAMLQDRAAITQTRTAATMVDMTGMQPEGGLSNTGFALGDTANHMYIVYSSTGGTVTMNLSSDSGIPLNARWISTADGSLSGTTSVTGGSASQPFVSPFGATPAALVIVPPPGPSISSITPSSCSFIAGTMNGPVCNLTVNMRPSSTASTAALTLTGTNSGAFHLVGPGCANISLGTCTIQQSSAVGGTPVNTYADVSAVATQSGIFNSPFTQALHLTGTTVPTILSISVAPFTFVAQAGNANGTVGTLSATVSSGSFGGTFALGTGSGCPGTNNSSFVISGNTLKLGASDVTTAQTYNICVIGTDAAFTNSPKPYPIAVTGQAPGACTGTQVITDAASYAPNSPITVTTCGGAGNPQDYVILVGHSQIGSAGPDAGRYLAYLGVSTSSATVTLFSTRAPIDRDIPYTVYWYSNNSYNLIATSAPFIITKSINPAAPTAPLPASEAADPFVPAHVVTVCASGCDYTSLGDATNAVTDAGWDNVQVKISSGEYQYPASNIGSRYPAHLWIKGIGTTMPHLWGLGQGGSIIGDMNYYAPGSGASLTIDNLDIGPWTGGWAMTTGDGRTVTLRNDYVRDAEEGYITGNSNDFTANFYNVYFARSGNGAGPEHNVYIGEGNNGNIVNVKNSVFEQPIAGHAFKERSNVFNASCSMFIVNADDEFIGSEALDMDSGSPTLTNNMFINSGGAGSAYENPQAWDNVRYGVDHNSGITVNQPVVNNNIFLRDQVNTFAFGMWTFGLRITNPPATFSGNTWIWAGAGTRNANNADGFGDADITGAIDADQGHGGSLSDYVLDATNHYFNDRASAGLPPIGSFPKGYRDYLPFMPAACTDPIGLVAVPPS